MVTSASVTENVVSEGAAILVLDKIFGVPELADGNGIETKFYNNLTAFQWLESKAGKESV